MNFFKKGKFFYFIFDYNPQMINFFKQQRAMWDKAKKMWKVHEDNLRGLTWIFKHYSFEPVSDEDYKLKQKLLEEPNFREGVKKFIEDQLPKIPLIKYHFKTKPMLHQSQALLTLQRANGRHGLLFEMGTGKSKIALDWVTMTGKRALIVAPKTVISGSWIKEVVKHSFLKPVFLLGSKKKRQQALQEQGDVYFINYEGVLVLKEELLGWIDNNTLLILDESIRIKNPNAKVSKALLELGKKTNYKVIMTGLPATKGYIDLFNQLRFLDCYLMPNSLTAFKQRYCIMGGFENREIIDYKNTEELEEALRLYAFQKTRDECLDLPPKVYEERVIEPNAKLKKLLKLAWKQELVDTRTQTIKNKIINLRRLSGGFWEDQLVDDGKVKEIETLLEENQKLVVWCSFRQEADYLYKALSDYNPVLVYGKMKSDDVTNAVNSFQNNPDTRVFIGIPAAVKYGVTLTAANVAVYYSNNYSLDDRLQSEDRIYRKGQDKKVVIIDLIMKGGVDGFILENLAKKNTEAQMIKEWLSLEEKIEF